MAEISGNDLALVLRAASFSADRHRHQKRKGHDPPPYINHPIEVASMLANVGSISDVTTLVAALLHDTVEDTSASADDLETLFGHDVRALVEEVTDDKDLDKAVRKRLQIEHTPSLSVPARQIKLGDKICNMRDVVENPPTDWSLQRRRDYLDWAELVVAGCRGANDSLEGYFDRSVTRGRAALDIIAAAIDALPAIATALDPKDQPAGGSWVALTVHAPPEDATSESSEIHRSWYTWRYNAPLESLDEAAYLELTRDADTNIIKVPVWSFQLEPLENDAWRLGSWFAAPLRMWMGAKAGDRVKGYGVTYVARPLGDGWQLEFEDVLAG